MYMRKLRIQYIRKSNKFLFSFAINIKQIKIMDLLPFFVSYNFAKINICNYAMIKMIIVIVVRLLVSLLKSRYFMTNRFNERKRIKTKDFVTD